MRKAFLRGAKKLVNKVLKKVGHRIDMDSVIPQFERFSNTLRQSKLVPNTIVDIGIAEGTPWLYTAFPDAKYFLVDPTPQSAAYADLGPAAQCAPSSGVRHC